MWLGSHICEDGLTVSLYLHNVYVERDGKPFKRIGMAHSTLRCGRPVWQCQYGRDDEPWFESSIDSALRSFEGAARNAMEVTA